MSGYHTNFYNILRLKPNRDGSVQRIRSELVFVDKRRSKWINNMILFRKLPTIQRKGEQEAYLLTGSLIATRKSWACSAMGEKASRMICPSSGLIQIGLEEWSGLRWSQAKSCSMKICETRLSCCLLWADMDKLGPSWSSSFPRPGCLVSARRRVSALKLMVAPRGRLMGGSEESSSSSEGS